MNWCGFSWEAFATLFTGVLAVAGVIYVSRRQLTIIRRQVELEQQKFRLDLFDRRLLVYEITIQWLRHFWANNGPPSGELMAEFDWAISKAQFLFRPEVSGTLTDWQNNATIYSNLVEMGDVENAEPYGRVLFEAAVLVNDLFLPEMRVSESKDNLSPVEPEIVPEGWSKPETNRP